MKQKGFLSQDMIVQALGLVFSIVFVGLVYSMYIRPEAQEIEITNRLQMQSSQDGEELLNENRSMAILLKDFEQQICITLMMWATIIIIFKFMNLKGEQSMVGKQFLQIDRGERILPQEALGYMKDVEGQVRRNARYRNKILPAVIMTALQRFDATRSIQDAAHAVKERIEMAYEQLESNLSLIRYIAWAIPSVGFIGTVRGIGEALAQAEEAMQGDISGVTSSLGLAFNSTLIALFLSIILMFFVHMLQSKQENLLIDFEELASKKVIAMMKTPNAEESNVTFS